MNDLLTNEKLTHPGADSFDLELARLLDQITARLIAGECLDLEALAREHRQHAEALRELVPAMAAVAQFGQPDLVDAKLPLPLGEGRERGDGEESPLSNRELGDFRIIREIGRGGMGVVYEAEQLSLGRRVALKVLPMAGMLDERQLQRFKNEARAAATLQHTNIVPVYAVGAERGVHFYAMQLVAGRSMAEVLDELRRAEGILPPKDEGGLAFGGTPNLECDDSSSLSLSNNAAYKEKSVLGVRPSISPTSPAVTTRPEKESGDKSAHSIDTVAAALPTRTDSSSQFAGGIRKSTYIRSVVNLAIQAAGALDHAHAEGIVHRDIKPANLLLASTPSPSGRGRGEGLRLWVTDFGLARIQADVGMTITGDLVGTMRYMSPEQALAQRVIVDHRTDIYSLGVTLYELLTLRPTFDGADRQELLRQIAFNEPTPPRKLNSSILHDLETIVLKAIEKNPSDRYATAREFADDLEHFLRSEPIRASRATLRQKLTRWSRRHVAVVWSAAAVFMLIAVVFAAATAFVLRERDQTAEALKKANDIAGLAKNALDDMYDQFADEWDRNKANLTPQQKAFVERAAGHYEELINAAKNDTPSIGAVETLHRLASMYDLLGDESCQAIAQRAVDIGESLLADDPNSYEKMTALAESIAILVRCTGGDNTALCTRAVGLREKVSVAGPSDVRAQANLAQAWASLANAHHCRLEYGKADVWIERAYQAMSQLVARNPTDADCKMDFRRIIHTYICTRLDLGSHRPEILGVRSGQRELGQKLLREGIGLVRPLFEAAPNSQNHQDMMAMALMNTGFFFDSPQSVEYLREAAGIWKRLREQYPEAHGYQWSLWLAYNGLGPHLLKTGHFEEYAQITEESVGLTEYWIREGRGNSIGSAIRATAVYRNLAWVLGRLGRDEERQKVLERNLVLLQSALKHLTNQHPIGNLPQHARWQRRQLHELLAQVSWHAGHREKATEFARLFLAEGRHQLGQGLIGFFATTQAWLLVTWPDERLRNANEAMDLVAQALKQTNVSSDDRIIAQRVQAIGHLRKGNWKECIAVADKSVPLEYLVAAMARWQLGERDQAIDSYQRAARQMDWEFEKFVEMRFGAQELRAEAEELLGIKIEPSKVPVAETKAEE